MRLRLEVKFQENDLIMKNESKIPFMGITIDNLSSAELVENIFRLVEKRLPVQVVGLNVDQIVRVKENSYSKTIFQNAALVFVDGKPIQWMCRLLGYPLKERITGPDLMDFICKEAAPKGYRIFLLGAGPGVAKACGDILREKYPGLVVTGSYSPPFGFQDDKEEIKKINTLLKNSKSDMLFVGMGSPKQDIFIYENMNDYGIPVSFSMGAALDFLSGNIQRAPRWMVRSGLEWLYRVSQDPKRLWKRYFVQDMQIVPMFIKEFYNSTK